MNPRSSVSKDLKRMAREDALRIRETETNPKLDSLPEEEFAGFEKRLKSTRGNMVGKEPMTPSWWRRQKISRQI